MKVILLLTLFAVCLGKPKKDILPSFQTMIKYIDNEELIPQLIKCLIDYAPYETCIKYGDLHKGYCLAPTIAANRGRCADACSKDDEKTLQEFLRRLNENSKAYNTLVQGIIERGDDTFEEYCQVEPKESKKKVDKNKNSH